MKTFIILTLAIIAFFTINAQVPEGTNDLDTTSTWRIRFTPYIEVNGNYQERRHFDYEYVLGGDTIAYNRKYKKLWHTYYKDYHYFSAPGYRSEGSTLDTILKVVALYREDSGKYYISMLNGNSRPAGCYTPKPSNGEFLVADMNLVQGDTIDMGIHYYDNDSLIFRVSRVDSVFTGWDFRKRITLQSLINWRQYSWVEGIGPIDLGGPFGPHCYQFENWTDLYCWEIVDPSTDEVYPEACALLKTEFKPVGIYEHNNPQDLIIKENPREWKVTVSEDLEYELYDIDGVLLEKGKSIKGKIVIGEIKGFGILKVYNTDYHFSTKFFNQ